MKIKLNLIRKRKHFLKKVQCTKELIILSPCCLLVMNEPLFIFHWLMLTPDVSGYSWSKLILYAFLRTSSTVQTLDEKPYNISRTPIKPVFTIIPFFLSLF